MSKEMQKVVLYLEPIEVTVEKGKIEEELIRNAKIAAMEHIKSDFPNFEYALFDVNALNIVDVEPGMVVEGDEGAGIVTSVSSGLVNVILAGNKKTCNVPELLKVSNKSYKEVMVPRRIMELMKDFYCEGDCGYIISNGRNVPVVIGKKYSGAHSLWNLEELGKSYSMTDKQLAKEFIDIE
ncbi:hypothetical protein [Priestia megaterium]|uniref:Uncharacterized protein n=1 Tax=Priestia megaterium TaxID=1404 RepID=A0A6M6E478_PRIMG|nr:hypothetical protein [Priestia megaterium]QJX79969.1 hypothetical protein FDZ14_28105 [Priestia megaterium]